MISKVIIGVSALISLVYVVVDEIAVNYMLAAANGATMSAADRRAVDFAALHGQAQAAVKDLQDLGRLARNGGFSDDRSHCRDQAWPYYSGACLTAAEERQVRIVSHETAGTDTAAPKLMHAANF